MIKPPLAGLLFILSALAPSAARGTSGELVNPAEWGGAPELLSLVSQATKAGASGTEKHSPQSGCRERQVHAPRCEALFSNTDLSQNPRQPWYPICSPLFYDILSPAAYSRVMSNLTCSDPAPSQSRAPQGFQFSFHAPTDFQFLPEPPLSSRERRGVEERFTTLRELATNHCCREDDGCATQFRALPLRWCNPRSFAEPCPINAEMTRTPWAICGREDNCDRPIQNPLGHIRVRDSALLRVRLLENDELLLHELGHACSWQKQLKNAQSRTLGRELTRAFHADIESYDSLFQSSQPCQLPPQSLAAWTQLFYEIGVPSELFQCFTQGRFNETCHNCPRLTLNETFAMVFSLLAARNSSEQFFGNLRSVCHLREDRIHPLGPEVVGCLLNAPGMRNAVRLSSNCEF